MPETTSTTAAPSLFFDSARACKEWLNTLALSNVMQAQTVMLDALRVFNRAEFDPLERLKCLELLREKAAFVQGELRSRLNAKTLPLAPAEAQAWTVGRTVLEEMEAGYRRCLGEASLAAHHALIAQRVIRYIGAQMTLHAAAYRRFDPQLWVRLNKQYGDIDRAGAADQKVKDSLEGEEGASSVAQAYAQVLLVQAAGLPELTLPQQEFIDALARLWSRKVKMLARPPEEAFAPELKLFADVEELSKSIRRRIRALQGGEDVAKLALPSQVSSVDPLLALQRLQKRWCEAPVPAPAGRAPTQKAAGLAFGVNEIYYFITGGKIFEQPGQERELSRQEKEDIAVFGRVTERTQSLMVSTALPNFSVEPWEVTEEALGEWRLQRKSAGLRGVAVGRLVAIRFGDTGAFALGMVKTAEESEGRVAITVAAFPGKPEAMAVRAVDSRHKSSAKWSPGYRLAALEKAGLAASLVVQGGTAYRGRGLQYWDGSPKDVTVHDILERGADFERLTLI